MALGVLLCFSILTDSARERWALSLFQGGVLGLAIVWAIRMLFRPYRLSGSILLIPMGGTVLWGLLQIFADQTVYQFETWNATLGWAVNIVVFLLCLQIFVRRDIREIFLQVVLYFGFVLSVVSVVQFFTSGGKIFWFFSAQYADQALGPFVNRDHYASFVALVLPLALYQVVIGRRNVVAYAAMAGAMFASVIAGASRAGAILVVMEIPVLLWPVVLRTRTFLRRPMINLTKVVFFVAIFTAVVGWGVLWERFKDPDPYLYRREMLYSSISMVRERPWIGFGLGTWATAYPAYALFDTGAFANNAHNDWAEWAAEGGIPFFLMLLSIFVWSVRYSIRFPWGVGVVAVFLHGLVDFPLHKPSLAALTFVLLGALAASSRDRPTSMADDARSQLESQDPAPISNLD
jgi:O-antigen ligase